MSSARDRAAARARGRHLLRSRTLAEAIVCDAGVEPGDLVVDVGAGSGMLTGALARAGARVRAIEPDAQLAARLRRACPGVQVVERSALDTPWPGEPFRVVANLPFAHATEILRSLLSDSRVPLFRRASAGSRPSSASTRAARRATSTRVPGRHSGGRRLSALAPA